MTKQYALLGYPITGSLSPHMHNAAFEHYKIDSHYALCELKKSELAKKIKDLRTGVLHGANISIPYKKEIVKFVDKISPVATLCQSVNTLYMENQCLIGDSTDGIGAIKSLEEKGINIQGMKIAMIGTGGAARAVLSAIIHHYQVEHIILGRNSKKIDEMVDCFGGKGVFIDCAKQDIASCQLIINATSVGMPPQQNMIPINPDWLMPNQIVFDLIYKPLKTKLLCAAETRKLKILNGLPMLIHQGAKAFHLWTGIDATEIMKKSLGNFS